MIEPKPQVTLSFTTEAVNIILDGLAQLPLWRSMALFDEIKRHAAEQIEKQKEHHGN